MRLKLENCQDVYYEIDNDDFWTIWRRIIAFHRDCMLSDSPFHLNVFSMLVGEISHARAYETITNRMHEILSSHLISVYHICLRKRELHQLGRKEKNDSLC